MEKNFGHGNIGWVDLLRVVACFLVVLAHCCDPFVGRFDPSDAGFLAGVFTGSAVRASVPLFVMITGMLLLPVKTGAAEFYKKRLGRIVWPLVFWSLALPLMYFVYTNFIAGSTSLNADDFTLGATLSKMYTFVFNFNYDTTPLWYLYMLGGLYLAMPIVSGWLREAPAKEIRTVLYIWGATLFIPYIRMFAPMIGYGGNYGNMGLLGVCDWNEIGTFHYVSGFMGYMILAHYLVRYPLKWSMRRTLAVCVPMFVVGYLMTAFGFLAMQRYFPADYAYLEIVWYFTGINVFMMTFAIFVLVQKSDVRPPAWLSRLSALTFGIYLCHFIFVQVAYDLTGGIEPAASAIARIIVMALLAFAVSAGVTALMGAFRMTRRFVK